MKKKRKNIRNEHAGGYWSLLSVLLNSNKLLVFVITLFFAQGLWTAWSFSYPMVFDEQYHFDVITIFSKQLSPFIENQPTRYDYLRDLEHIGSLLYHYLMSFPLRVIAIFVESSVNQVILMRILNVLFASTGLFLFAVLFKRIGIKTGLISLSLFAYAMIPVAVQTSATINYDNLLTLLTPIFLIFLTNIVKQKSAQWRDYALTVLIGVVASLVKYTFLPIFFGALLFICVLTFKRYGRSSVVQLKESLAKSNKFLALTIIFLLTIVSVLFTKTYIFNLIEYGSPQPSCTKTLGLERCRENFIVVRNINARETKNQREPMQVPDYSIRWLKSMFGGLWQPVVNTRPLSEYKEKIPLNDTANISTEFGKPMPLLYTFSFFATFIGLALILLNWQNIVRNKELLILLSLCLLMYGALYIKNMSTYYNLHKDFAIQSRYLLGFLPIILVTVAYSADLVLKRNRVVKILLLIIFLAAATQGGGMLTYVMRGNDTWYWSRQKTHEMNNSLKTRLAPLIKEN